MLLNQYFLLAAEQQIMIKKFEQDLSKGNLV